MSSDGSVASSGSRIRQFGLYRTIDARTEEFLRSSRKRQIRQGCACAAISTAITVTVVVVILLIYEYVIAVDWSSVHSTKGLNRTDGPKIDQPFADRLDRSYFGLDQDYYERMPLLINALQESNYFDPILEMSPLVKKKSYNVTILRPTTSKPVYKPNAVRRTSPRPFFFEYRGPTPLPFSKTYGSKSWFERYRNEERLKNIRQIIKYLETTINAKVGDMHSKPTQSTQIAFTGLYIEPMLENKSDLHQESSDNHHTVVKSNHLTDPLFNFKPENPGDVNLLADDFLRFSPTSSLLDTINKKTMFRQIPFHKRNCPGNKCENNDKAETSAEIKSTEMPPATSTTKSFSVMLNLFPIKKEIPTTTKSLDNIYLTTSRPLIKFKRKSSAAIRRVYTPYKRPKYLSNLITKQAKADKPKENKNKNNMQTENGTQMIVHVKVYSPEEKTDKNETNDSHPITIPTTQTNPYTTKAPIELSTSQIEDYHAGSSGYIPVQVKSETPSLPKETTEFFEKSTEYPWPAPTEVLQFNVQDAKVPNQYIDLRRSTNAELMQISRRNFGEYVEKSKPSTLVVKLKNEIVKTTLAPEANKSTEKVVEATTAWTYVPQINGHYRSINQNSKNVNTWLNRNQEVVRKKRLEQAVSGFHTSVPIYKEIRRNHTETSSRTEDYENDGSDGDDVINKSIR